MLLSFSSAPFFFQFVENLLDFKYLHQKSANIEYILAGAFSWCVCPNKPHKNRCFSWHVFRSIPVTDNKFVGVKWLNLFFMMR